MVATPHQVAFHDARLSVPVPGVGTIDRPRVMDLLDREVRSHSVTLVVGPGGCGKTYAVALWARSARHGQRGLDVAWVSLDRADGQPHRFWGSVVGALQRAVDAEGLSDLVVPSSPTPFFVDSLAAVLGRLDEGLVLVLDDVHALSGSSAFEALEQLQRCLPEQHRLVLLSRHDPPLHLHRIRLAGRFAEVRFADLSFTTGEATELLRASGLDLDRSAMEHLMCTTEGWAAGLRLAMIAIEGAQDPNHVVAQFSGRHSLVSAYLLEEVVSGLGADRTDFLTRTCVVDRICAPLARALSGTEASGAMLESLVRDNVLVSALEDSGWFHYHPMFLEMLRARLVAVDPDLSTEQHRRAQRWFEGAGEWWESLRHARLSGDEDLAAQVALRTTALLVFTPERARLAHELAPLTTGPAQGAERQLCRALAAYGVGDEEGSATWTSRAEAGLADLPEPRRQVGTLVHRLLLTVEARRQGDPHAMLAAAREAETIAAGLTPDVSPACEGFRVTAVSMLGISQLWSGQMLEAEEHLRSSAHGMEVGVWGVHAQVYHGGLLALSEVFRGEVHQGRARARTVLEVARTSGWSESYESGAAWLALAVAHLYAADLLEVDHCLTMARQTRIAERDPFIGATMALVTARRAVAADDLVRARRHLVEADRWVRDLPRFPLARVLRSALAAEVHLAAGDPARALAALPDLGGDEGLVAITRSHVLLATGHPEQALAVVDGLRGGAGVGGAVAAEAWLVAALAQDRLRRDASSLEAVGRALDLAAAEGAVLGFLRPGDRLPLLLRRYGDVVGTHTAFLGQVLDRIEADQVRRAGSGQASGRPGPSGPVDLTQRELSVLAYLPTLSTNDEIAAQLNISVNTVKQHLKMINRKLGVGTRREAVRAGRRLGLLPNRGAGSGRDAW